MSETPPTAQAPAPLQRLRRIEIRDYKAIDALDLEFPPPLMAHDPDITVVGSANGVGKTSLLECCALARHLLRDDIVHELIDPTKLSRLIRAGATSASVKSEFDGNRQVSLTFSADAVKLHFGFHPDLFETDRPEYLDELFGISPNPLIDRGLLFFHGARKVVEGVVEMDSGSASRSAGTFSVFKDTILDILMDRAHLFDDANDTRAEQSLEQLNKLLETFTPGRIDKIRRLGGGRVELRIATARRTSFPFDGLSAGQKEIVSLLFLIWHTTRDKPALVLIDEPELHLNAEWHREFVRYLHNLAPHNQYILASHSQHIFASVDRDCRILLAPEKPAR